MAKSIYRDKAFQPDGGMIASALKETKSLWDDLIAYASDTYPNTVQEWKYYGAAWGWCLVLHDKKKKIAYLTPSDGFFWCSFSLNEKGRALARQASFPDDILKIIEAGKDNPAGHVFDITVDSAQRAALSKQLLKIKVETL